MVQLYVGEDKSGEVFDVPRCKNISVLKKAVIRDRADDLGQCHPSKVLVYKPGVKYPGNDNDKLSPGKPVPNGSTDENPLLVVAPAKEQQQPGKSL